MVLHRPTLTIFLVGLFALFSGGASSQTIDLDIKGLKVTATYKAIVAKLGKPITDVKGGTVPCGDRMRTLKYPGMILRLESGGMDPLGLYKVEVTSRKWSINGVRIGDRSSKVIQRFGQTSKMLENRREYLPYFIPDGYARFYLRGNRVSKIEWEFNFC